MSARCEVCLDTGRTTAAYRGKVEKIGYCPKDCKAALQARAMDAQIEATYGAKVEMIPAAPEPSRRAPMTHVLKTAPAPWLAVRQGIKTAEFRRDDRGFQVGDTLDLRFITEGGDSIIRRISHVQRGPAFGIPEGYAMLSFEVPHA